MEHVITIENVRNTISKWKKEGYSIGYVPTMGFLHDGHASLIDQARKNNDKVIVSIFVNPIQFGENEDLSTYPRDINSDKKLCESHGVDLIFTPSPEEMYQDKKAFVDILDLSNTLCGIRRPIHFKGVCTVVAKFFNIIGVPIVREQDGLAKSSRNTYLSSDERKAATILYKSIQTGKEAIKRGASADSIINTMTEIINTEPLAKIDYISVVDANTMQPVEEINAPVLVAMAVYIGSTRLIDNFSYDPN